MKNKAPKINQKNCMHVWEWPFEDGRATVSSRCVKCGAEKKWLKPVLN